jgi:hypothetical protein
MPGLPGLVGHCNIGITPIYADDATSVTAPRWSTCPRRGINCGVNLSDNHREAQGHFRITEPNLT